MSDEGNGTEVDEEGGATIEFVDDEGNVLFDTYFDQKLWSAVKVMSDLSGITPQEFVMNALLNNRSDDHGTESQDK